MSDLLGYLVQNEESFRKARLPALYSDFRGLRTINPDGYQANVSAWRRALGALVRSGLAPSRASTPNLLVLNADESLLRALESKQYGRPLALGAVVREAALEKDLIPLQDFLKARESIYHKSWTSLPWNVVSWGLRQLGLIGGVGGDDRLPNGQFVVLANLEAATKAFGEQTADASSRFERTFSKAHFQKTFANTIWTGQKLSETDLDVLLKFMSRDKGLLLYDGKTIKIKTPGVQETDITAEDESIASLKELTEYLEHQTSILNKRIDELTATAKDAVTKKNRVAALAAIKSKKLAESSLATRFATLSQLEEVAAKIEQAADNVQLVNVMSSSTQVLKGLNAKVGGAERVEEVVDHLREQMSQADEVGSILAESGPAVDEGEIDDELEALEKEEKAKEEALERAREEAERAKKEAEQQREAEETAKKLAELGALKPITNDSRPVEAAEQKHTETKAAEPVEELSRMSLEESLRRNWQANNA